MNANELFYFLRKNPVNLLRYLPPFLAKDATFKDTQDVLSTEHENLRTRLVEFAKQFFVDLATWSMADWENFVGVTKTSDDLEARRAVVKAKLMGGRVMTVANTNELIRSFTVGNNSYVDESIAPNHLRIVLLDRAPYWRELVNALLELMPAHLTFDFERRVERIAKVFAGMALGIQGLKEILPSQPPTNYFSRITAGNILMVQGGRDVLPAIPRLNLRRNLFGGQVLVKSGEIILDAHPDDFPKHGDISENALADLLIADVGLARAGEIQPHVMRHEGRLRELFAAQILSINGDKKIDLARQPKRSQKLFAGIAFSRQGEISIGTDTTRKFAHNLQPSFANVLVKSGTIFIDSVTKPSDVPDFTRRFAGELYPKFGVGLSKGGAIDINLPTQIFPQRSIVPLRFGHALTRSGEITILPARVDLLKPFTAQDKSKLDSIEDGAQVNVVEKISLNGEPLEVVDKAVDVEIGGMDKPLAEEGHVAKFDSEGGVIDGGGIADDSVILALLDEIFAGLALFSAQDKSKLDSIEDGAQVNVVEKISINGEPLTISGKTAEINLPTMNKTAATEGHVSAFGSDGELVDGGATFADDDAINDMLDEIFGTKSNFSDGDRLRMHFDFPNGAARAVQLQNPRGDLSVADVKQFGNKTAELKILQNSKGALTTGINRAELIRDVDLKLARDGDTLPAADALNLTFGKNQVGVKNLRNGVTVGEIKRLDKLAANIFNGKLKRAALVKKFKIDDGDAPIKF